MFLCLVSRKQSVYRLLLLFRLDHTSFIALLRRSSRAKQPPKKEKKRREKRKTHTRGNQKSGRWLILETEVLSLNKRAGKHVGATQKV